MHFVLLQQLAPFVLSMFLFQFQRFQNLGVFLGNLWIIGCTIINIAQYSECFFASAVLVQVARRFGESKNKDNDELSHINDLEKGDSQTE